MEIISSADSNTKTTYFAFFDLDLTIIRSNSARTLIQAAYKKGLMSILDLIKGYYLSLLYKLNLRDPAEIIKSLSKWLKNVSEDDLENLTSEIFKNQIVNSIHQEVLSEIDFHKSKGGRVVILSSSIYPICNSVADHLGMDDVICSNLEVINGVYTGRSAGPFCFGKEKAVRLKEYCSKKNINPTYSWYYGDSISDHYVLNAVGNPVCVNPDKKLEKIAIDKGWKILRWQ